ncbi:MAG: NAD-dependent epimerase/dehydratase family protein [bacterium]
MKLEGKNCIVTGAAGFIGSHLCEILLQHDASVIGIDCLTDYYEPKIKRSNLSGCIDDDDFTFREENVVNVSWSSLLEDIDVVFHQSAQAGVRASWGTEFDEYIHQNIRSTQVLLEALKTNPADVPIVLASSSSVYGVPDQMPMVETMRTEPHSPYGVTKLAAENLGMLYHNNFDIPVTSLRYFTVYGPRQRPDMAFTRFLSWIYDDRPITVYGDGTQSRDFTFVLDACRANLAVVEEAAWGRIFNVGGGQNATLNEMIDTMEQVAGKNVTRKQEPPQKGDVPHTSADTNRIEQEVGWNARIDLKEGLERQWEWIVNRPDVRETVLR